MQPAVAAGPKEPGPAFHPACPCPRSCKVYRVRHAQSHVIQPDQDSHRVVVRSRMKTWRLQVAGRPHGSSWRPETRQLQCGFPPSWLYQVGSPTGRRNELMMGDIHKPQRRTSIMFWLSSTRPSLVKSDLMGAVSRRKQAAMKVRLSAKSQAGMAQLMTPAKASANNRFTPPVALAQVDEAPFAQQRDTRRRPPASGPH